MQAFSEGDIRSYQHDLPQAEVVPMVALVSSGFSGRGEGAGTTAHTCCHARPAHAQATTRPRHVARHSCRHTQPGGLPACLPAQFFGEARVSNACVRHLRKASCCWRGGIHCRAAAHTPCVQAGSALAKLGSHSLAGRPSVGVRRRAQPAMRSVQGARPPSPTRPEVPQPQAVQHTMHV